MLFTLHINIYREYLGNSNEFLAKNMVFFDASISMTVFFMSVTTLAKTTIAAVAVWLLIHTYDILIMHVGTIAVGFRAAARVVGQLCILSRAHIITYHANIIFNHIFNQRCVQLLSTNMIHHILIAYLQIYIMMIVRVDFRQYTVGYSSNITMSIHIHSRIEIIRKLKRFSSC